MKRNDTQVTVSSKNVSSIPNIVLSSFQERSDDEDDKVKINNDRYKNIYQYHRSGYQMTTKFKSNANGRILTLFGRANVLDKGLRQFCLSKVGELLELRWFEVVSIAEAKSHSLTQSLCSKRIQADWIKRIRLRVADFINADQGLFTTGMSAIDISFCLLVAACRLELLSLFV